MLLGRELLYHGVSPWELRPLSPRSSVCLVPGEPLSMRVSLWDYHGELLAFYSCMPRALQLEQRLHATHVCGKSQSPSKSPIRYDEYIIWVRYSYVHSSVKKGRGRCNENHNSGRLEVSKDINTNFTISSFYLILIVYSIFKVDLSCRRQ